MLLEACRRTRDAVLAHNTDTVTSSSGGSPRWNCATRRGICELFAWMWLGGGYRCPRRRRRRTGGRGGERERKAADGDEGRSGVRGRPEPPREDWIGAEETSRSSWNTCEDTASCPDDSEQNGRRDERGDAYTASERRVDNDFRRLCDSTYGSDTSRHRETRLERLERPRDSFSSSLLRSPPRFYGSRVCDTILSLNLCESLGGDLLGDR